MISQLPEKKLEFLWKIIADNEIFIDWEEFRDAYNNLPELFLTSDQGGMAITVPLSYLEKTVMIKKLIASPIDKKDLIGEIINMSTRFDFEKLISPILKHDEEEQFQMFDFKPFQKTYTYRLKNFFVPTNLPRFSYRWADEQDLEKIMEIDRSIFEPFWWFRPKQLLYYFQTGQILIALSDSKIIGYNIFREHQGIGNIIRIGIVKSWRRKGVAKSLLWESLVLFLSKGIDELYLCTQADNLPAQKLYQELGFQKKPVHTSF